VYLPDIGYYSVGTLQETNIFEEVGLFLVCICYVVYMFKSRSGKTYHYYHNRSRRGRDHMVVGFTTTYALSTYHH